MKKMMISLLSLHRSFSSPLDPNQDTPLLAWSPWVGTSSTYWQLRHVWRKKNSEARGLLHLWRNWRLPAYLSKGWRQQKRPTGGSTQWFFYLHPHKTQLPSPTASSGMTNFQKVEQCCWWFTGSSVIQENTKFKRRFPGFFPVTFYACVCVCVCVCVYLPVERTPPSDCESNGSAVARLWLDD